MHVMGRLDLLPRRRLAVVILAALVAAAAGGGSVAAGKYDAAAAASRPWGSYSYGGGARAAGTTVVTPRQLAVEDVVAPEFIPVEVELVGGGYISFPSTGNANRPACSPNCANPSGKPYTRPCTYKNHCTPNQ
ncbi:hypothetical protein GUJ93_ZPchr0012g19276 [Zizania palustris]|uniref:Uncharacterized protein n=1 Tax=Zizania palustris TaxID=103762 RepID=A0A8J5WQH9_ZIZPA|nr:hypothetical protein GUJ93_ZPchr0012g19276 [Zizania palustris]